MKRMASVATVILALAGAASGQVSLWSGGGEQNIARPAKMRDFEVHEIVHIVVIVTAESTTEEETELEKSSDTKMSINEYIKLKQGDALLPYLKGRTPENLQLDLESDKTFEGEGTSEREDVMRTRVAAEIVEIKPNGNLVIEAKSRVRKSREQTVITLSGIVRPQDVGPDNSVYSYNIADLDINYESKGPVTDANRRGWFLRFLDAVWPF
ncbi:MAG: flagellar basal body L-ring protein FlgH [Planctomycetota bacterium]|jgi:flagellar L-ring protein precursor FlgH